ncbi:MAG: response regulator transcription factor [Flavobacteriaceae bacterium]|nr:PAS domain-containing protein [Bacteroidia bacterium]NNL15711.1 response regulator transcription factor [Flavobacteriaceae bacterium]
MTPNEIEEVYKEIFNSYDKPNLSKHIEKIIELDEYLPYSSTFFCITDTQKLAFHYISKSMYTTLGYDHSELMEGGMKLLWNKIHPEDVDNWLHGLNELMEFTTNEIPIKDRNQMSYTWNYRLKNDKNEYVNIVQNTTPLGFDTSMKPIIGLAHYTVLSPNITLPQTVSAKLLNAKGEYETKYFNNLSQKLLSDGITNRERDIIRLLILDYSSKEIAEKLFISSKTVDTHRRNILKKLNISSTGELVGILKINKNLI